MTDRWDLPPINEQKLAIDTTTIERAIKVKPDTLSYRLDNQEREEILLHEELRELAKSALTIGILGLLATVI